MIPQFKIVADGSDATLIIADRLLSLSITDEAGFSSDTCSITIDDREGAVAFPRTGAALEVALGYVETGLTRLGRYVVDEISLSGPPATMKISGKAADLTAARSSLKEPAIRSWDGATIGEIARSVAAASGLEAVIAPAIGGVPVAHADQTAESDLHFLTRLVSQYGGTVKPADGKLVIVERAGGRSAGGRILPTVRLTAGDIATWSATIALRGKYTAVKARYHDHAAAREETVMIGDDDGAAFTLGETFPDEASARAAAQARRGDQERGSGTLELTTAFGRPELMAEGVLEVGGLRAGVDGTWSIRSVTHDYGPGGFTTRVSAETPRG